MIFQPTSLVIHFLAFFSLVSPHFLFVSAVIFTRRKKGLQLSPRCQDFIFVTCVFFILIRKLTEGQVTYVEAFHEK